MAAVVDYDSVIILDFGSQVAHLIARRVRELNVYCTMLSCLSGLDAIKAAGPRVKGLILSGGPASVYEADAPHLHVSVLSTLRCAYPSRWAASFISPTILPPAAA